MRDDVARLKLAVPAGSCFKGHEDILVRDLRLSAEVVRDLCERWVLPSGETVLAPLPAGIVGGFGPELRRFELHRALQGTRRRDDFRRSWREPCGLELVAAVASPKL